MNDQQAVRAEVLYSGDVQGVGFRMRTRGIAAAFRVAGWVRNLPDGRVELAAEGERQEVESFLAEIDEEMERHIDERTVDWQPARGESGKFRIAY